MTTRHVDVLLKAYDLLQAALDAESVEAAIETVRGDLQVLSPDMLLLVATALAVEPTRRLVPRDNRAQLRRRLEQARAEAIWAWS